MCCLCAEKGENCNGSLVCINCLFFALIIIMRVLFVCREGRDCNGSLICIICLFFALIMSVCCLCAEKGETAMVHECVFVCVCVCFLR